jgi:cytochrome c1
MQINEFTGSFSQNYDLALYYWDKLKVTMQGGYRKRPARKANAEAFLRDHNWTEVDGAFKSRDKANAWDGFELARNSCMSCHEAEKVTFVNNQSLFHDTEPPAKR